MAKSASSSSKSAGSSKSPSGSSKSSSMFSGSASTAKGDDTPRTKPADQQRSEGSTRPVGDPAGQKFKAAGDLTLSSHQSEKSGSEGGSRRPGADAINPRHTDPKKDDAERQAAWEKHEATEQAKVDANSEERTNAVAAEDAIRSGVSAGSGPTRVVLEKDGGILRLVAYGLSPVDTGSILESADLRDGDALAKIRKRGEERAKATGLQWFDQTALPGGEVPARGF